jgi:uncharacterized membrane protein YbhN (UPF0104 family)
MRSCTGRPDQALIRKIWRWGRLIGGAGILALLAARLGSEPFLNGLRVVDRTTLTAALAIGALTTVLSAWRWSLVASGLGMRVPLRNAIGGYYRSLFINAVLPGGVLGDVHRAVRHGRGVGDVSRAAKAVVLERSAGQIALVGTVVTVLILDPDRVLPRALTGAGPWIVALAVAATLLGIGVLVARGRSRWALRARAWTSDVRQGLLSSENRWGIAGASIGVLAGHLATFVIAARAAGNTTGLVGLAPLLLLALLAMTLPLNVGGWGPREGVTVWAFSAAGLGAAQGLTVAVVYGMFAFVASLPGAAVLAIGWIAAARADRRPHTVTPAALPAIS